MSADQVCGLFDALGHRCSINLEVRNKRIEYVREASSFLSSGFTYRKAQRCLELLTELKAIEIRKTSQTQIADIVADFSHHRMSLTAITLPSTHISYETIPMFPNLTSLRCNTFTNANVTENLISNLKEISTNNIKYDGGKGLLSISFKEDWLLAQIMSLPEQFPVSVLTIYCPLSSTTLTTMVQAHGTSICELSLFSEMEPAELTTEKALLSLPKLQTVSVLCDSASLLFMFLAWLVEGGSCSTVEKICCNCVVMEEEMHCEQLFERFTALRSFSLYLEERDEEGGEEEHAVVMSIFNSIRHTPRLTELVVPLLLDERRKLIVESALLLPVQLLLPCVMWDQVVVHAGIGTGITDNLASLLSKQTAPFTLQLLELIYLPELTKLPLAVETLSVGDWPALFPVMMTVAALREMLGNWKRLSCIQTPVWAVDLAQGLVVVRNVTGKEDLWTDILPVLASRATVTSLTLCYGALPDCSEKAAALFCFVLPYLSKLEAFSLQELKPSATLLHYFAEHLPWMRLRSLHFEFKNVAMGAEACRVLLDMIKTGKSLLRCTVKGKDVMPELFEECRRPRLKLIFE